MFIIRALEHREKERNSLIKTSIQHPRRGPYSLAQHRSIADVRNNYPRRLIQSILQPLILHRQQLTSMTSLVSPTSVSLNRLGSFIQCGYEEMRPIKKIKATLPIQYSSPIRFQSYQNLKRLISICVWKRFGDEMLRLE